MELPINAFKQALREGKRQIGLWVGLADSYAAELLAATGFDCLVIDAEHAPNDPRSVLRQLQAIAAYPVHPIVRPVAGSVELIKQYLDIGAQTLIIPMVETAEQAALMVAATRYPTRGCAGSAAHWRAPRAGIRSPITWRAATTKSAYSSKWNPSMH
jgi:4-hydroxy-2-oxoheptanedioate aldolase